VTALGGAGSALDQHIVAVVRGWQPSRPRLSTAACKPGVYHPSVRTEGLLPRGHLHGGFQAVTWVAEQHALRLWQRWQLVH
jgi:hypothetical protein